MLEAAFTGAIGRDPELKTSASGKKFCSVPVAVGSGDATTWIRVAMFGELAVEFAGQAKKGETVAVEGTLKIGTYTGKDGKERISFDVVARYVRVAEIGRRRRPNKRRSAEARKPAAGTNNFHSDPIGF
jgi:single stranded DNA-binding protein